MRRWIITAAVLLAVAGALGLLAAATGVIPITASSGHFAITERLLVFAKERSIATHTIGKSTPPLDDPVLILRGAGHFETGCRPCHGAPDLPRLPRVPRAMLPPPPNLSTKGPEYDPEELFYIVKHGIKFTGMPAWPSLVRDDEITAMVAFLTALPKLDAAGYRRLVHGEPPVERRGEPPTSATDPLAVLTGTERAPRAVVTSCARCHGLDGRGRENAAFPALAAQREQYFVMSLEAYASDRRQSGIMQSVAATIAPEEMREIAEYYARQPPLAARAVPAERDAAAIERGRAIAEHGVPDRRVPSCSDCHGPGPGRRHPGAPALAGQYADYLVTQLQLFAEERRGGTDRAHLMSNVAPRLTREHMHDVARYYESLTPVAPGREEKEREARR